MELKKHVIEYRGSTIEIRELTIGQIAPMFKDVREDGKSTIDVMELMKRSVFMNGQPVGDGIEDLPGTLYTKLLKATTEVNALGEQEGND